MPLPRRAELVAPEVPLGQSVELLVVRHDEVGVTRQDQPGAVDPCIGEAVHLGDEHSRINDHAVSDDRNDVVVEDPARQELEREGATVHDDRVTGVVAALITHDHVHSPGQEVGQLPLALVTPLGADYDGGAHPDPILVDGRAPTRGDAHGHRSLHVNEARGVSAFSGASTVTVSPST